MVSSSGQSPLSFTRFGDLLRYLRLCARLTQRELAIEVGYHYAHLCRLEKNQRLPDPATVLALFVPALGLENQPEWSTRLVELASAGRNQAAHARIQPASQQKDTRQLSNKTPTGIGWLDSAPTLPAPLTCFLGRETELAALEQTLARPDVRLLTLIGPPGVGKTRLALHCAENLARHYPRGVWLVELAPLSDAQQIAPTVAQAFGIVDAPHQSLPSALRAVLSGQAGLLVLDNCEHLVEAAASLAIDLLRVCPTLHIIATSREKLGTPGENLLLIHGLQYPVSEKELTALQIEAYPAVQLFCDRARHVQPSFTLTDHIASAVAKICRLLEGMPLALELAAARLNMFAVEQLATQLTKDNSLRLLRGAWRNQSPHQQTLHAVIDWSFQLLTPKEAILLRRLAIFAGGWSLEAAERVCTDEPGPVSHQNGQGLRLQHDEVLELLANLVSKSLVVVERLESEARYRLLYVIQQYAHSKLKEAGEQPTMTARHLLYFASWVELANHKLHTPGEDQKACFQRIEEEHVNLRAALDRNLHNPICLETCLQLAGDLGQFWFFRGYVYEGLEFLKKLLALDQQQAPVEVRLQALFWATLLENDVDLQLALQFAAENVRLSRASENPTALADALWARGFLECYNHPAQAYDDFSESEALCRALNDDFRLSRTLAMAALTQAAMGKAHQALDSIQRSLEISQRRGDFLNTTLALRFQAVVHYKLGDYAAAQVAYKRCAQAARQLGDRMNLGTALESMAFIANLTQDYENSARYAAEALEIYRETGNSARQPFPRRMLGYAALHLGDMEQAAACFLESLRGNQEVNHLTGAASSLVGLAEMRLMQGQIVQAVRMAAAAEKVRQEQQTAWLPPDNLAYERLIASARQALQPETFAAAWEAGCRLTIERALAEET